MKSNVTFRTEHGDAEAVARVIRPDNTEEIDTSVEGDVLVTRIERGSLGSVRTTMDDYLRNLSVAVEVFEDGERRA